MRGLATDAGRPRYAKNRKGETHYWIETPEGIMDLNFGPTETPFATYWP